MPRSPQLLKCSDLPNFKGVGCLNGSEDLSFNGSSEAILKVLSQSADTVALISDKSLLGKPLWARPCAAVVTGTLKGFNAHRYLPESELVFCPDIICTSVPGGFSMAGFLCRNVHQLTPFWCIRPGCRPPPRTCLSALLLLAACSMLGVEDHKQHFGGQLLCGGTGTLPQQALGWTGLLRCKAAPSPRASNYNSRETLSFP